MATNAFDKLFYQNQHHSLPKKLPDRKVQIWRYFSKPASIRCFKMRQSLG